MNWFCAGFSAAVAVACAAEGNAWGALINAAACGINLLIVATRERRAA